MSFFIHLPQNEQLVAGVDALHIDDGDIVKSPVEHTRIRNQGAHTVGVPVEQNLESVPHNLQLHIKGDPDRASASVTAPGANPSSRTKSQNNPKRLEHT